MPGTTQAAAARHLGLSPRQVRELRDLAVIPDPRRATLDEVREAYIRHVREIAAGRRGDGRGQGVLDLAAERARLSAAQARAQELRNAELEGRLLDRVEVVATWSTKLAAAKRKLRAIPGQARTRIPAVSRTVARALAGMIDEALDDLAGNGLPERESRHSARAKKQR